MTPDLRVPMGGIQLSTALSFLMAISMLTKGLGYWLQPRSVLLTYIVSQQREPRAAARNS